MKQSFRRFVLSEELAVELLRRELAGELTGQDKRHQVAIGRFPKKVLEDLRVPDCALVTSVSILVKCMTKHRIPSETIAKLPDFIKQPVAAYESATERNSIVVVTLERRGGGTPLLLPFRVNAPDSANKPNMHWMTSAYEKDEPEVIEKWERDGLLIWKQELELILP